MNPHGVLKRTSQLNKVHDHIKWDEQTIQEQAKHRGQCPKIPEPKTPYSQPMEDEEMGDKQTETVVEEDQIISKHLREAEINSHVNQFAKADLNKLNEQLKKQLEKEQLRQLNGEADEGEVEDEDQQHKHEQFLKKRAEHYSEYKKIQDVKKKHPLSEQ